MKISVQESDGTYRITLAGKDATPENIEEFKNAFERGIEPSGQSALVLDITDLNYLGSEGVGVIASAHKRLHERGRRLIVRNPTQAVARVLMVTRLDNFLEIERTTGSR